MSSSASESDAPSPQAASPDPPASPPAKESESSKKRKNELDEIEVDLTLPEPPSKKAKRALKKGKPLPPKKDSDDDEGEANTNGNADGEQTAAKPKEKERSPYGVWIGNLRFTVTKDDLRHWLVDNSGGAITESLITRVHLPASKHNKGTQALADFENRGFAYVDFATYEATVAAIALSETEWHRRKLLIKDAKSYEGRPEEHKKNKKDESNNREGQEGAAAQSQSTSRKVFVGNMSFQTTEDDLRELFSKCGEIEWVKVATFEDSGKCKGYGWVKFKEAAAADWAAKGFVKIKEIEETEEDFMDVDDEQEGEEKENNTQTGKNDASEDDEDEDEDNGITSKKKKENPAVKTSRQTQEKKVKTRKWWVNQLNGRRLKIEHAEDDQTRYKKRYGKKDPQQQQKGGRTDQRSFSSRHNNTRTKGSDGPRSAENGAPAEVGNFRSDINVARLTGAAVKPEGKKTTFE